MAGEALLAVVALLAALGSLALFLLVRAEHGRREETDRESAERAARRDTDDRE